MNVLIVTGAICSGKSTYIASIAGDDTLVLELDKIGHEVLRESRGDIDRAALADIVFEDRAALVRLEAELHPRIMARVRKAVEAFTELAGFAEMHDARIIIEAPYTSSGPFDIAKYPWLADAQIHTCEASYDERLRRALERGMTQVDFERRDRVQGQGTV